MKSLCSLHKGVMIIYALLGITTSSFSQPSDSLNNTLNLFMDCYGCDMNYIRTEMPYINFVRDVKDAQVYLMVTRQPTGSGGTRWTLLYNGQERFAGMRDTIKYDSSQDDTFDVTRTALTNAIALGLMRYVAKTPIMNSMLVRYHGQNKVEAQPQKDNWDFWVFEINTEPQMRLEKREEEYSWRNGLRINRVTEEWKLLNNFNHNYRRQLFFAEVEDPETGEVSNITTIAERKSWSFNNLTVKSLGDHWSAGMRAGASSSTYSNLDLRLMISPAIEYNVFPYSQSNQRQLVFQYGVNFIYHDYSDTTIYNKMKENLMEHSLNIAFQVQEKWGNANFSVGAANYLNDFEKNSVYIDGFLRVRILRGLSVYARSGIQFIHNQIELRKGGTSAEDVYLRLRELETNYRFDASLGLSYTFGSIYNNIVNPRF